MSSISSLGGGQQALASLARSLFKTGDADGSGGISLDEFKVLGKNLPGGKNVSETGASGGPDVAKIFSKIDADGDGSITEAEFTSAKPPQPPFQSDTFSSLLSIQEDQQAQQAGGTRLADIFALLDTDKSGGVSRAEFGAAKSDKTDEASTVFDALDTDKDGTVSSDESNAFLKELEQILGKAGRSSGLLEFQQATSAYGSRQSTDTSTSLLDTLLALDKQA